MKDRNRDRQHLRTGRMRIVSSIFVLIGIMTVLYLLIAYVILPVLAMLTV